MRSLRALSVFAVVCITSFVYAESRTHCVSGETDFFTCSIAHTNKVASLCGSRHADSSSISWLQYRFGQIGHPEMVYPLVKDGSADKFYGKGQAVRESAFYQYDIWFGVGAYNYSVSALSSGNEQKEIQFYVYFEKINSKPSPNPVEFSGSFSCLHPTDELMGRVGELQGILQSGELMPSLTNRVRKFGE